MLVDGDDYRPTTRHRRGGEDALFHLVAESNEIDACKQRLAATEQDRRYREMHLVDEPPTV